MWAIYSVLHKYCPGGILEDCDLWQMGTKEWGPELSVLRMKLIWNVWLPDEVEQGNAGLLQLKFWFFLKDFAWLQGRVVEVIQTQPLIFMLHYHPDCGCLLSSVFGWKAVSVRNNFHWKIQKTQLTVVYDVSTFVIYYLLNRRYRWSQCFCSLAQHCH